MLEQLRRNSRSFLIWVLFGIIIAAFVLTFGTQEVSPGCASGSVGSRFHPCRPVDRMRHHRRQ
jgi:hypothetical protein